jgi:hypothetical protein
VLLADVNWQVQNGLSYALDVDRREVAAAWMDDVVLYLPRLVADNRAIGREVVLTGQAGRTASAAYGPQLPIVEDTRARPSSLNGAVAALPPGTRYLFSVLKPTREHAIDWQQLGQALASAAGGRAVRVPDGDYAVIAGVVGQPPAVAIGSSRPFDRTFDLGSVAVRVRMESWLNADTIRRMGFGHVIVRRQHTLILERGISFVAFDQRGRAIATRYAAGIFELPRRSVIRAD